MKLRLPIKSFGFFKVLLGCFVLSLAVIFSAQGYVYKIAQFVGGVHVIGAYIAMWKSGKLNLKYVFWIVFITIVSYYVIFKINSVALLLGSNFALFYVHFLFDEFDLQEEKRSLVNVFSIISPLVLLLLFLARDFMQLFISCTFFVEVAILLLVVELIFLKEITWFFIHTKILTIFLISALFLKMGSFAIWSVVLIYHYFFWFIYPVYKLHKYKREERDSFIMLLVVLITLFTFIYSPANYTISHLEGIRVFLVVTVVHILTTAPFGYLFGLPKPKYEVS